MKHGPTLWAFPPCHHQCYYALEMVHVLASDQLPRSFYSIHVPTNNALVPIFSEGLKCRPKKFCNLFESIDEIQFNLRSINQFTFLVFCIFNKLSKNIIDIFYHDVKPHGCKQDQMNQQHYFRKGLHMFFCPKIIFSYKWIFEQSFLQIVIINDYNCPSMTFFLFIVFE